MTTSERIKGEVMEHLAWDDSFDASKIQVAVSQGKVLLTGTVSSYPARVAAERDVRLVPGVTSVENQLQVEPQNGTSATDEDIRSRVQSMLAWDALVNPKDIKVRVKDGVVTLEGSVDAYWKRFRAEDLASDVGGVIGMTNRLKVAPRRSAADDCIATEVHRALRRSMAIDAERIKVKVKDGVVILSGTVPTWDMRFAVEDTAKFTTGVTGIVNKLKVD
ncbi:MAG: BON domain-containing protein [Chloroflexi bacterium]|nr:BON domain-containing protein [Chloroflexota bacterium]